MLFNRKAILSAILTLFVSLLEAQNGALLLSHYMERPEIENQSWDICQDGFNVMLFANRRGILTFDGKDWLMIPMPAVPRSIKYNKHNNIVYSGCDNNYGYLKKDDRGIYRYISLSGDSANIGLISGIIFTDTTVYFYGEKTISRHNLKTGSLEKRFASKEDLPFTGMLVTPKNTFINVQSKGLYRVEADTLFPIVTGYLLENTEIYFSLPYDNNFVLLGLSDYSLRLFDGIKFSPYKIKDDGYLRQNLLSEGISISDSVYAFSTTEGGAIVVEKKSGKLLYSVNYQKGLPDDEVLAIGADNSNGLWLSHQFGLTRADLQLPVKNFSIYLGLEGNLTSSLWHGGELFVATSEGVYYLAKAENDPGVEDLIRKEQKKTGLNIPVVTASPELQTREVQKTKKGLLSRIFFIKTGKPKNEELLYKPEKNDKLADTVPQAVYITPVQVVDVKNERKLKPVNFVFRKIGGLNDKCKQLVSTPDGILASTAKGLYIINNYNAKYIVNNRNITFISEKSKDNRYYIASTSGYFYVVNKSGVWTPRFPDNSFTEPLSSIASVGNDLLWAGGDNTGYRISLNPGGSSHIEKYSIYSRFPQKYLIGYVSDTVFLLTESGVSYFNETKDSFISYDRNILKPGPKFNFIYNQPDAPWITNGDEWLCLSSDKNVGSSDKALLKIFDGVISISISEDFILVVTGDIKTGDNQLYRIERKNTGLIKPDMGMYIKSIISGQDTLRFERSDIVFEQGDNPVEFNIVAPGYLKMNSNQYQYLVEKLKDERSGWSEWSGWSSSSTIKLDYLPEHGKYILKVRSRDIWGKESELPPLPFTIKAPFTQTTFFYIIVVSSVLLIIILIVRFRERKLKKDKQILEEKVQERTAEIEAQKQEITSSIEYASRIQMAMLPVEEHFRTSFSDHFVIFKPRDIVSGDFYWIGEDDKHIFFTVADCTGHGVPGAFMSTMGIATLNEIITNKSDLKANKVLNLLREKTKTSLHQTGKEGEASDGMDIAFCILHKNKKTLEYSGAYIPLILVQRGEIKEYRADRMPIGIYYGEKGSFTNYEINVKKGDTIYIFSDGFTDQFGGPEGGKYKRANLKKLLSEIYYKPMAEQRQILENEFEKWKGKCDQIDDVTIIGVRI
jgi:serine phosphatase RsbU (regulator of sigma subunit)